MTDRPLQLALRELRADFTNPKGLLAFAGLGVLLGISGPFETYSYLGVVPRIIYWLAVTYLTYAVGAFTNMYLQYRFGDRLGPFPIEALVCGFATGIGVMAVLTIINFVAFGWYFRTIDDAMMMFGIVVLISVIIVALLMTLTPLPGTNTTEKNALPPLLDRLALDKCAALVALSVQDHYVNVTTRNGQEMLLMRLSDAIRETAPTRGMQVHRSHWVALDQIAKVDRVGDRAILTMSDGSEVPVSRSYIPALRDAGIIPRSGRG